MKRYVPEAAEKITVIHNLTDVKGIREKAKEQTEEWFNPQKFHIVSVGRVSYEKGMDIAVRVCAKLVEDGFRNICWWIVGDGPVMQEIRKMIAELGMESYMKLVGMKENPYPYIRQASLYVQPSRFEGYPMTILEALVIGKPVISTYNNGAKEILQDRKNGLLCSVDILQIVRLVKLTMQEENILNELKENIVKIDFEQQNEIIMKLLENIL